MVQFHVSRVGYQQQPVVHNSCELDSKISFCGVQTTSATRLHTVSFLQDFYTNARILSRGWCTKCGTHILLCSSETINFRENVQVLQMVKRFVKAIKMRYCTSQYVCGTINRPEKFLKMGPLKTNKKKFHTTSEVQLYMTRNFAFGPINIPSL